MIGYSILPGLVALLFFEIGVYTLSRPARTNEHAAFAILCLTTCAWQAAWAVLFQLESPALADILSRVGYCFIFFLPTSIYHFLVVVTGRRRKEIVWVYTSYAIAAIFSVLLLSTDWFISGHYDFFWGKYPKAGVLHPLHMLQTAIVVVRGLFITYQAYRSAAGLYRTQLGLCAVSILIFFLAAVDYLCNYGIEVYPPGAVFITISLSIFAFAVFKKNLLNITAALRESRRRAKQSDQQRVLLQSVAGNIAHELRTPLVNISLAAGGLSQHLPQLMAGYEQGQALAQEVNKEDFPEIDPLRLNLLKRSLGTIDQTVSRAQQSINLLLANVRAEGVDKSRFEQHDIKDGIEKALQDYPFQPGDREKLRVISAHNFSYFGSDSLLIYVLNNLLKNALFSLKQAGKGEIRIETSADEEGNILRVTDTGAGMSIKVQQRIFEDFYTTKPEGLGNGLGLSFCQRVMHSFDGSIECRSVEGDYTAFILRFPKSDDLA